MGQNDQYIFVFHCKPRQTKQAKMDSMWDTCLNYLKTDEARRQLRENVIVPMGDIMYNEMYFYVWFICIYHVFLILIILANLVLLLKLLTFTTIRT